MRKNGSLKMKNDQVEGRVSKIDQINGKVWKNQSTAVRIAHD